MGGRPSTPPSARIAAIHHRMPRPRRGNLLFHDLTESRRRAEPAHQAHPGEHVLGIFLCRKIVRTYQRMLKRIRRSNFYAPRACRPAVAESDKHSGKRVRRHHFAVQACGARVADRREIQLQIRFPALSSRPDESADLIQAQRKRTATRHSIKQPGHDAAEPRPQRLVQ